MRVWNSTTYVFSFKPINEFGPCLRREALRRGMGAAGKVVVVITDGAEGLKNMADQCFRDSVKIVDFYHAMEHAGAVLEALIGREHPDYQRGLGRWARRLLKDKVLTLVKETRKECAGQKQAAAVEQALGYFVNNADRMQYGTYRASGYFIGSAWATHSCFLSPRRLKLRIRILMLSIPLSRAETCNIRPDKMERRHKMKKTRAVRD